MAKKKAVVKEELAKTIETRETEEESAQELAENDTNDSTSSEENESQTISTGTAGLPYVVGGSVSESNESEEYVFPNFPFATDHEQRKMGIDEIRAYAGKLNDLVQRGF